MNNMQFKKVLKTNPKKGLVKVPKSDPRPGIVKVKRKVGKNPRKWA